MFKFPRAVGLGVAVLAAAASIGVSAGAASAAEVGTLSITPNPGTYQSGIVVNTSGPCPGGTNLFVKVYGAGFPAAGYNVVANSTQASYPTNTSGGKTVALSNTMKAFAESQSPPVTLSGDYRFELICRNSLTMGGTTGTGFGEFNGKINFATPINYTVVAGPNPATSSAITASPVSPSTVGTNVTFTSTVTAADGSIEAGSVQFQADGVDFGAAQPIAGSASATGTASVATTSLAVGSRTITAVFTSTAGPQTGSTGTTTYSVTAAPIDYDTTTTLTAPTNGVAGSTQTLTATVDTVDPAGPTPVGTVQFKDNGVNLGLPVAVNGSGVATKNVAFGPGQHSLTAVFTPTNEAAFNGSTSAAVVYTASGAVFPEDVQYITGVIPAGTIIITTPYTQAIPLNLGTLALNSTGSMFFASAAFEDIVITDTRAGNLPWTASAISSNLTNGATGVINSQNVGLTNLVPTYTAGNALQAITVTNHPAAPGVAPGDTGTLGLGNAPHEIARASNGAGTVEINGLLTLNAPSSTQAGTYNGTVTFTVAGS